MGKLPFKIACLLILFIYLFSSITVPVFASMTYSYDTNGNMNSDGTYCYTYNDANQVSQVKNCSTGKVIAQYVYDYMGNRIVKKGYDTSGNLQQTTYTPTKSYETKKLANNTTQNTAYYFINDQLVARKNSDNTKNYYLSDNLGSTSVLTDQNGNVVENTTYYPFGDIRSGGTKSKQLYTGQINDPETGLDYYNARYYNSHIRRFTQPDDVIANVYNPQDLNRYSYVNNNPLTLSDPSGHCFFDPVEFLICSAIFGPVIIANAPALVPAIVDSSARNDLLVTEASLPIDIPMGAIGTKYIIDSGLSPIKKTVLGVAYKYASNLTSALAVNTLNNYVHSQPFVQNAGQTAIASILTSSLTAPYDINSIYSNPSAKISFKSAYHDELVNSGKEFIKGNVEDTAVTSFLSIFTIPQMKFIDIPKNVNTTFNYKKNPFANGGVMY